MENSKIRVGISQGDINGISYEVIIKTFMDKRCLICAYLLSMDLPKLGHTTVKL
jgi:4-hydroxy-L-threonine phosphate dehydrogenase PdxA